MRTTNKTTPLHRAASQARDLVARMPEGTPDDVRASAARLVAQCAEWAIFAGATMVIDPVSFGLARANNAKACADACNIARAWGAK